MKILNEDGSLLFEFRDGLGAPLLYRVLAVAKFTGEDQPEIILNEHVAALHKAISEAMPPPRSSWISTSDIDGMAQTLRRRVGNVFRAAVLRGDLDWLAWDREAKRAFTRNVLFSPYEVSDQFIADFVEEEDYYFDDVHRALESGRDQRQ